MVYIEKKFQGYLSQFIDKNYANFSKKLGVGKLEPIGIRVPKLREIAKDLSKQNWQEFFENEKNLNAETVILKGLCLGYAKLSFDEFIKFLSQFFDMVESWAEVDISASSFKIIKKNMKKTFDFILPYLLSKDEYKARLATVILLDYFVCDDWIDVVLNTLQKISFGKYYIDMAVAWLLSVCFVKFRDKTLLLFQKKSLPKFVQNKAIQKCRESFRVAIEDKILLLNYKI